MDKAERRGRESSNQTSSSRLSELDRLEMLLASNHLVIDLVASDVVENSEISIFDRIVSQLHAVAIGYAKHFNSQLDVLDVKGRLDLEVLDLGDDGQILVKQLAIHRCQLVEGISDFFSSL